jgi:hypothetical protein
MSTVERLQGGLSQKIGNLNPVLISLKANQDEASFLKPETASRVQGLG